MTLARGFTLAAAETEITRRLIAGERVLLVGAHRTNLPQALAEHPQVQLWDSEGARQRMVPAHARIVLFTKWVGHNQHKWIREDAAKDRARFIWPELLGTGEIRRLLQPLVTPVDHVINGVAVRETAPDVIDYVLPAQPTDAITTLPCGCQLMPGVTWGGTAREFVEKHWSHDVEHTSGWQVREAKRLHRLAAQHGLVTAQHYMEKLVSQLNTARVRERDEQQLTEDRERMAREALEREKVEQQLRHAANYTVSDTRRLPPVAEVPAIVQAAEVLVPHTDVRDDMSELLRMIDDAQAVLGLARETLVRLAKENAEQRGSRERLERIRAALADTV
jgi:hypothetical protein